MDQVFSSTNDVTHNYPLPYLNSHRKRFSKILFLVWLAAFTIINSSFKNETLQSSVEKATPLKKTVPFKGSILVTLGANVTSGTGVGSHIGKFQYFSVDDYSNFPKLTDTATFIAANRDEIYTTFSGDLTDSESGTLTVIFENTITGGTGRFAGATGSFTSTGIANTITGTANTTFTGTISY